MGESSKPGNFANLLGGSFFDAPEAKVGSPSKPVVKRTMFDALFRQPVEADEMKKKVEALPAEDLIKMFVLWKRVRLGNEEVDEEFHFPDKSKEETKASLKENKEAVLKIMKAVGATSWGKFEIAASKIFAEFQFSSLEHLNKFTGSKLAEQPAIAVKFKKIMKSKAWGIGVTKEQYGTICQLVGKGIIFGHPLIMRNYLATTQGAQGVKIYQESIPTPTNSQMDARKKKFNTCWDTIVPTKEFKKADEVKAISGVGFEVFFN